jgi:2-iminobutanoate/2-iminopropanoate deaminase
LQAKISNNLNNESIVFHQLSSDVPTPIGHYCHAAELPNGLVALSGIKAWRAGAGTHIDGDVQEQACLIFRHVDALLTALELRRQNIFKISVHLESVQDYEVFNSCYAEWLDSHKPARTVLAGYTLRGGAKLELVVEAYRTST